MEGFPIILPLLGLLLLSGAVSGEQTDREESVKYEDDPQRDGDVHPRGEAPREEIPYLMRIRKILRDLIDSERVVELASSVVRSPRNSVGRDARNEADNSGKIEKRMMNGAASTQNINEASVATATEETTEGRLYLDEFIRGIRLIVVIY